MTTRPPFVDEHRVVVSAPPAAVWRALGASLRGRSRASRVPAVLLGAVPGHAAGDPLRAGSTIPGFAVRGATEAEELVLAGRHRFSDYELVFELRPGNGTTTLTAHTSAAFPGLLGAAYRAAVFGSGAHRVLVRRWLDRIRATAEAGSS
jgi:hypothetical protein